MWPVQRSRIPTTSLILRSLTRLRSMVQTPLGENRPLFCRRQVSKGSGSCRRRIARISSPPCVERPLHCRRGPSRGRARGGPPNTSHVRGVQTYSWLPRCKFPIHAESVGAQRGHVFTVYPGVSHSWHISSRGVRTRCVGAGMCAWRSVLGFGHSRDVWPNCQQLKHRGPLRHSDERCPVLLQLKQVPKKSESLLGGLARPAGAAATGRELGCVGAAHCCCGTGRGCCGCCRAGRCCTCVCCADDGGKGG